MRFDDKIEFEYSVERTRRRTVAIYVRPYGVAVRAPKRASDREIRAFVLKKQKWILKKLDEVRKRAAEVPRHTYLDGDIFQYRGEPVTLRVCASPEGGARSHAAVSGSEIVVNSGSVSDAEAVLRKWYLSEARRILNQRVTFFSRELGVTPLRISVRNQSKRWGSCSSKRNLNLNMRLVMAPPDILDYVVAHELCHLKFLNHSAGFWRTLGGVMPDYAKRRDWLRKNGHRLEL